MPNSVHQSRRYSPV